MSNNNNNNPHGHANQPPAQNPSWNPLQIPSYIPRQPQLAHMSNERPMVRSPLAWHAPAPPDSIYNFMSANHKNLDHQMNPLLPPYVRGPSPFDSMDLSVQSTRSSSSPLSKSGGGSSQHPLLPHDYVSKQQQQQHSHTNQQQPLSPQQTQLHVPNNYSAHLSVSSPHAIGHSQSHPQQQQASLQGQPQHKQRHNINPHAMQQSGCPSGGSSSSSSSSVNVKYLNTNGGDCDMLPPALVAASGAAGGGSGSGSGSGAGATSTSNIVIHPNSSGACTDSPTAQYMRERDSVHMQENYSKISTINRNYENEISSKGLQKPVELINKDCNFSISSNKTPHPQQVSPKKLSPLSSYQQHQQNQPSHYSSPQTISHNGPHTPPTPQSPAPQQQQTAASAPTTNITTPSTMQQLAESRILQRTGNVLDYNQLHLQHNNAYQAQDAAAVAHPHQQQMPSTPQQATSHQHHNQQQQQQSSHHSQFGVVHRQPTSQQQSQPQSQKQQHLQQIHPQLQHHPHHQLPPLHHQVAPCPPSTNQSNLMTNSDAFPCQTNPKLKELEMASKTAMADLSSTTALPGPTAAAAAVVLAAHLRAQASAATGTFAIRNTSPDNVITSNEDSADSNSNSSRVRRKRKPNKLTRASSNDSLADDDNAASVCLAGAAVDADVILNERKKISTEAEQRKAVREQTTHTRFSNTSPKQTSDTLDGKSPNKEELTTPSLELSRCPLVPEMASNMLALSCSSAAESALNTSKTTKACASSDEGENDKIAVENGCTAVEPPQASTTTARKSDRDTDVETIDKIAEMIAKTGDLEIVKCHSSSIAAFEGGSSAVGLNIDSPKTKKQRQALKLRNAEQHNSNSNCSTNSYNESLPDGAATDNAVLAEELHKVRSEEANGPPAEEAVESASLNNATQSSAAMTTPTTAPTKAAPSSPPPFIHNCSSSSSSSSTCSNSSRSCGAPKQKNRKGALELTTNNNGEESLKEEDVKTEKAENMIKAAEQHADCVDVAGAVKTSPKRELMLKYDDQATDSKNLLINSCTGSKKELLKSPMKSCFEEVENKLEEMFAGIEDEPPTQPAAEENTFPASSNVTEVASDLSLALELVTNGEPVIKESTEGESSVLPVKVDKTPPTKAAKKSTVPSPSKANTSTPPTRIVPPRRRLSVVEPTYLAECTKLNRVIDDEQPSTSAAAAAAAAKASSNESCSSSSKKQYKTRSAQRAAATTKSKASAGVGSSGVGGASGVAAGGGSSGGGKTGKGKVKNKKQQQKKHKGKQQRDSDEEETTNARESNGGVNSGCAGGGNHSTAALGDAKYKSPYILVKADGSITVINAPTAEDVGAEKQTKVKKVVGRGYAQDRKNLRGMHSSTLSNKYDADTADMTWICVFCKRGPHRMGLGDLFGPYLVSSECEEYRAAVSAPGALDLDEVMVNKRRRVDMVQWHPRNLPVVPASSSGWQGGSPSKRPGGGYNKKKKKSLDDPAQLNTSAPASAIANVVDISTDLQITSNMDPETLALNSILSSGMSKVSETSYEVWLHEDCAVWAPAVFLVGARVMGLDAAVWNSTRYQCSICSKAGAMICCLNRDCHAAGHLPCARETQWSLDESNFKVFCHKHASNNSSTSNARTTAKGGVASPSATSVLAELLNRPPAKPTSSNLPPRRYS